MNHHYRAIGFCNTILFTISVVNWRVVFSFILKCHSLSLSLAGWPALTLKVVKISIPCGGTFSVDNGDAIQALIFTIFEVEKYWWACAVLTRSMQLDYFQNVCRCRCKAHRLLIWSAFFFFLWKKRKRFGNITMKENCRPAIVVVLLSYCECVCVNEATCCCFSRYFPI